MSVALGGLVDPVETWSPNRDAPDESFEYIDLSAIDQEAKAIMGARRMPCGEAPSRAKQIVAAGDVLVSTVRPNLNGVARVPSGMDGATASTGFCVLRPRSEKLDGAYLLHWVRSPRFIAEMVRRATGASYPAVSDRVVLESRLPLPSLPEQRRIAEVMDRSEALRAKRRAALAVLDTLIRSIFLEMFGDPRAKSKKWPKRKLGEMFTVEWGNTSITKESYVASGAPAYSASGHDGFLPNGEHQGEGIVLSAIGARCGKCFYVRGGSWTAIKNTITITPMPNSVVELPYIFPMVNDEGFWPNRGAGQPFITLGTARAQEIPVPPLPLQQNFARRVGAVEKLRIAHSASLAEHDALFASLQRRAFRGEL